MISIADTVRTVVEGNRLIHFGLREGLLNLSQVARHLQPVVEERLRKKVKHAAVLMGLCRLQHEIGWEAARAAAPPPARVRHISLSSDLALCTYTGSQDVLKPLKGAFEQVRKAGGHLTLTIGPNDVTVAADEGTHSLVVESTGRRPSQVWKALAAIGLKSEDRADGSHGVLRSALLGLHLHDITALHVASTAAEVHACVPMKDAPLAFQVAHARLTAPKRRSGAKRR